MQSSSPHPNELANSITYRNPDGFPYTDSKSHANEHPDCPPHSNGHSNANTYTNPNPHPVSRELANV